MNLDLRAFSIGVVEFQKKVKISNVKRSQHIKHKKNYARPQKNAVKAKGKSATEKALAVSKKVFGKPIGQKSKKRDRGQDKKQLYTSNPAPALAPESVNDTNGDTGEMDDDDVQDMLDMLHDDDNNHDVRDRETDFGSLRRLSSYSMTFWFRFHLGR